MRMLLKRNDANWNGNSANWVRFRQCFTCTSRLLIFRSIHRIPAIYRISYIWYSFLGAILTIVLGLIISNITDRYTATQILHLTTNHQTQSNDGTNEKSEQKQSEFAKNSPAIFIVEKYRKKSQVNHQYSMGVDNMALKIEEV